MNVAKVRKIFSTRFQYW